MPKRKYHTLHDDLSISKEATHRSRRLREKQRVRREIEDELAAWEEGRDLVRASRLRTRSNGRSRA